MRLPAGLKVVKQEVRDGQLVVTVSMTRWKAFLWAFKVAWDTAMGMTAELEERRDDK